MSSRFRIRKYHKAARPRRSTESSNCACFDRADGRPASDVGRGDHDPPRLAGSRSLPPQAARARIRLRGCELEGRPDLIPPPGGYDPEALYYVPAYFTLVKFRTMHHDARSRFPTYFPAAYAREGFRRSSPTSKTTPALLASVASCANSRWTSSPTSGGGGWGHEDRRTAPRSAGGVEISHSGRADQVHVQTRNHRSCTDQRAQIAHVGRNVGLGHGICPHAQRSTGSEDHLVDDQTGRNCARGVVRATAISYRVQAVAAEKKIVTSLTPKIPRKSLKAPAKMKYTPGGLLSKIVV